MSCIVMLILFYAEEYYKEYELKISTLKRIKLSKKELEKEPLSLMLEVKNIVKKCYYFSKWGYETQGRSKDDGNCIISAPESLVKTEKRMKSATSFCGQKIENLIKIFNLFKIIS